MNIGEEAKLSNHRLITTVGWSIGETARSMRPAASSSRAPWCSGAARRPPILQERRRDRRPRGSVLDNGGVYLVPAFVGFRRPHWDADARGLVIGLTRGTTRAHRPRRVGRIAFQCAEVLNAMGRDAMPMKELRVDGGAPRNNLLMQFQADLSGVPVIPSPITERPLSGRPSSRGSPSVFGPTKRKSRRFGASTRVFEPAMSDDERDSLMNQWERAVGRAANGIHDHV